MLSGWEAYGSELPQWYALFPVLFFHQCGPLPTCFYLLQRTVEDARRIAVEIGVHDFLDQEIRQWMSAKAGGEGSQVISRRRFAS